MASKLDLTDAGLLQSVEDFVAFSGGDHAIKKILIANNGIGATKAIRSIPDQARMNTRDQARAIEALRSRSND
jgi:hypothetical protein